jgi:hypothetical protein
MVEIVNIADEQDKKYNEQRDKQQHKKILEFQLNAFQFAKFPDNDEIPEN